MYNLAQLYLSGHFGEENQPAGVTLLEQAAERGNLDAVVMLARLHYNGQFVAEDRDRDPGAIVLRTPSAEHRRRRRLRSARLRLARRFRAQLRLRRR